MPSSKYQNHRIGGCFKDIHNILNEQLPMNQNSPISYTAARLNEKDEKENLLSETEGAEQSTAANKKSKDKIY